jgi:hypothetical protein
MECSTTKTSQISYSRSSIMTTNGQPKPFDNGTCACLLSMSTCLIFLYSELFGNENGLRSEGPATRSPGEFLAMVKSQAEGHRAKEIAAEASVQEPGKRFIPCTSFPCT